MRRGAPAPAPAAAAAAARAGPILSTRPLRDVLPPEAAAALQFGASPDGTAMAPDDFADHRRRCRSRSTSPAAGTVAELQADAELGADRNAVVRVMITDRPEGSSRDAGQRVVLGDPASAGYKTFRAGMAEYVALLPPNSHGEANPADKDPVPPPFDNTYNSPEHDAFVLQGEVPAQRQVLHRQHGRRRRPRAAEPGVERPVRIVAVSRRLSRHARRSLRADADEPPDRRTSTPAQIAALPAAVRPYVTALRAHYDEVDAARRRSAQPGHVDDALAFASRAWRRPLTRRREGEPARVLSDSRARRSSLDHDAAIRALIARILVSPAFLYRVETVASGPEKPLNGWEMASRLSFFLWSSIPDDELRRAAAAGELSDPAMLAKQVKRMTADPKARRLATEFFGQWLGFYHFDEYRGVDTGRFPEFTDEVQVGDVRRGRLDLRVHRPRRTGR